MIIPLMAIQLEILSELQKQEIKTCTKNFEFYILALLTGTLAGFYLISFIPESLVKIFLGVLTFAFAVSATGRIDIRIEKLKKKCFRRSSKLQLPLGLFSGIIFGATNIGVQIVAYLKTINIKRRKFVGLLALIMIPVSGLRIPLLLNRFPITLLSISMPAVPLGVICAKLGGKLADKVSDKSIQRFSILLMLLISVNLLRTAIL
jgi:uncharacterized membrane protein YfcA